MKTEELKALGLSDEQVSAVMELKGKYFGALESEKGALETQVGELTKSLDDTRDKFKEFEELDIEGIRQAAEDWKNKYEKEKEDREEDRFNSNLESLILAAKGKNPKLIKAALDLEALRESKDLTKAAQSALEKFKEENEYMFDSEEPPAGVKVVKPGGKAKTEMTKDEILKMDDTLARLQAIRENPNLFIEK